jgi:uncharacterized protein YndB with AHSA1/START domain
MIEARTLLSDAPKGEVSVKDDRLQVVFNRRYRHPIEKVWAALTTPERLADWFGAAEVDMREGGVIRMTFNKAFVKEFRIVRIDAPRLFAWAWTIDGLETSVRFELEPDGDGCRLTLTHSGLSPRAGDGAGVRAGWHAHLEGLADALDGRATPWALKTERQTAAQPLYPPLPA